MHDFQFQVKRSTLEKITDSTLKHYRLFTLFVVCKLVRMQKTRNVF